MFVENLLYVVVEGVGDKRNFESEEGVVSVGFPFWLFFVLFFTKRPKGMRAITLNIELTKGGLTTQAKLKCNRYPTSWTNPQT